jgi:hypothetical protein
MSLTQALAEAKKEFIAHTPLAIQTEMFRQIRELQESGIAYGRQEGQKAKDFTLKNALGETVNLYDELFKGPVVLTFYRGGWCPFCSTQLQRFRRIFLTNFHASSVSFETSAILFGQHTVYALFPFFCSCLFYLCPLLKENLNNIF